jgi:hypothetical protein
MNPGRPDSKRLKRFAFNRLEAIGPAAVGDPMLTPVFGA